MNRTASMDAALLGADALTAICVYAIHATHRLISFARVRGRRVLSVNPCVRQSPPDLFVSVWEARVASHHFFLSPAAIFVSHDARHGCSNRSTKIRRPSGA